MSQKNRNPAAATGSAGDGHKASKSIDRAIAVQTEAGNTAPRVGEMRCVGDIEGLRLELQSPTFPDVKVLRHRDR